MNRHCIDCSIPLSPDVSSILLILLLLVAAELAVAVGLGRTIVAAAAVAAAGARVRDVVQHLNKKNRRIPG